MRDLFATERGLRDERDQWEIHHAAAVEKLQAHDAAWEGVDFTNAFASRDYTATRCRLVSDMEYVSRRIVAKNEALDLVASIRKSFHQYLNFN